MSHVVLLGDSIFDNARYVPGRRPVIEQLRQRLPDGWRATLLACDGNEMCDVAEQLAQLPEDASHLVVSVGGNDALGYGRDLYEPADGTAEVLHRLADIRDEFRTGYHRMLTAVLGHHKPTAVCTIYDAIPRLDRAEVTALALFNEVILREAIRAGVPVLDLRVICSHEACYSSVSPIEPSVIGGERITAAIAGLVQTHDFTSRWSVVVV
jgi:hypothetical protein